MKQAYTNTIRNGGGNNPLTISVRKKNKYEIPMCAYGRACNRPNCAYRHPEPSATPYENYHDDPTARICLPFLAGMCTYGSKCMNRHPDGEEADAVRAKYKQKKCSYGDDCQTEGCLYWHPFEAGYEEETCQIVENLSLGNGHREEVPPTFEDWLGMNCPHPPTMDENLLYNTWHYPASGLQRDPWEVYCLMYPQQQKNLNATTRTWHPNGSTAAPQSWEEPYSEYQQQQSDEPKTFQEWKTKGQPNPRWYNDSYTHIDPWYTDEGVRRNLEEVYMLLYGKSAEQEFALMHQSIIEANDPTPAELMAMTSNGISNGLDDLSKFGTSPTPSVQLAPASGGCFGGWASIAKKPPVMNTKIRSDSVSSTGSRGSTRNYSTTKKRLTVVIPKEVWLPSTANSDCFHTYANPIERFTAVNAHHKSYLSQVTIPLTFEKLAAPPSANQRRRRSDSFTGGKVGLLDVHFQSAKTIAPVLNRFLLPRISKDDEVWIVTGSGSHVAAGHQKRESGGVLFNAVERWLEEQEEERVLEFRMGKDSSGGMNKISGGAFLVRKKT